MLDAAFYHQVTDENIKKTVEQILNNEHGFYRTEQLGTDTENAANLNRIWSTDQYSSSLYSSAYNKDYQNFRLNIFGVDQPYRNLLMQAQAKNPVFQNLMGVKYVLSAEPVAGYEKVTAYNAEKNAVNIYENKEALPIVYTTHRTISQTECAKASVPVQSDCISILRGDQKRFGCHCRRSDTETGGTYTDSCFATGAQDPNKEKHPEKYFHSTSARRGYPVPAVSCKKSEAIPGCVRVGRGNLQ